MELKQNWGKRREEVILDPLGEDTGFTVHPLPRRYPHYPYLQILIISNQGQINDKALQSLVADSWMEIRRHKKILDPIISPDADRVLYIGSGLNVAKAMQAVYQHLSRSQGSIYTKQDSKDERTIDIVWAVTKQMSLAETGSTGPALSRSEGEITGKGGTDWMTEYQTRMMFEELDRLCIDFPGRVRLVFFDYEDDTERFVIKSAELQ